MAIDRRNHIGGNCDTEQIEGIQVHRYGAHIFRTSSKHIWVVYTGTIDEYYDYCFGPLKYRCLRFEHEIPDTDHDQGVAVVNDTDKIKDSRRVAMREQPKVSVIMPSLNVGAYIRECMESVVNQTLKDIEIICIDAGSTDGTLEILQEYAQRDCRIKLIHSDVRSYGYQMNLGIDSATGEYMGIVETDDYILPEMYETLYNTALRDGRLDIVKAGYYDLFNGTDRREATFTTSDRFDTVIHPIDAPWAFDVPMMNPLGIFRLDYIRASGLRFNETPGAAQQDIGFWFLSLAFAQTVEFIEPRFYVYRRDNPNSSMNVKDQIYSVPDEYDSIYQTLQNASAMSDALAAIYFHRSFLAHLHIFKRFLPENKILFLIRMANTLHAFQKEGVLNLSGFSQSERDILRQIMEEPITFLRKSVTNVCFPALRKRSWTVAVSVIIPVYNTGSYLEECLDSVLNQTLRDMEVICVDDGSTDDSLEILRRYADRDSRVKVFRQPNMKQGTARNYGLQYANGRYVYFMDSDDTLDLSALEYLYQEAEENGLDVLLFDGKTVYETEELKNKFSTYEDIYIRSGDYSGIHSGPELFYHLRKNGEYRVQPCLQFFSHDHMVSNNLQFPCWGPYEDNVFSMKALLSAGQASHRNKVLYFRRIRTASAITSAVAFENMYGYYRCFVSLLAELYDKNYAPDVWVEISKELSRCQRSFQKYFDSIPEDIYACTKKMTKAEALLFQSMIVSLSEQKKRNAALRRRRKFGRLRKKVLRFCRRFMKRGSDKGSDKSGK